MRVCTKRRTLHMERSWMATGRSPRSMRGKPSRGGPAPVDALADGLADVLATSGHVGYRLPVCHW